ncbi:MAG: AgmX/PglI C-terminal domain-containing protein [Desulfomonilia bacterium]
MKTGFQARGSSAKSWRSRGDDPGAEGKKLVQVFIFKGENYLGWDCFAQDMITIGRSNDADVVLDDPSVQDLHAVVRRNQDEVHITQSVSVEYQQDPTSFLLRPFDSIEVGPYTLKIKITRKDTRENYPPCDMSVRNENETRGSEISTRNADQSESYGCHVRDSITDIPIDQTREHETRRGLHDKGAPGEELFILYCDGRVDEGKTGDEVKERLATLIRKDASVIEKILSGKRVILKRCTDYQAILLLKRRYEETGILCGIETVTEMGAKGRSGERQDHSGITPVAVGQGHCTNVQIDKEKMQSETSDESSSDQRPRERFPLEEWSQAPLTREDGSWPVSSTVPQKETASETLSGLSGGLVEDASPSSRSMGVGFRPAYLQDDDEDDDDDSPADFLLKDILTCSRCARNRDIREGKDHVHLIEIIKSREDRVLDVSYLHHRQKFHVETEYGRFCLAENRSGTRCYVYCDRFSPGKILNSLGIGIETELGRTEETLFCRRKGIYRHTLNQHEAVIISIGVHEYHIRQVISTEKPTILKPKKRDREYTRHMVKSIVFHVLVLTIIGMFPSFEPTMDPQETHFAQVDSRQMEDIHRILHPPVLPREAPPVVEKKDVPEQKTVKKPLVKKPPAEKSAPKKVASSSPKAGGGHGEGNIRNRNVNQTGILGMLGENIGLKPHDAIAAVTNLDAVTTSVETGSQFKVDAIVGKLGDAKIEIPAAGMVNTRGSVQVLRSAGVEGEGMIAALDKGETGQHQVMAMVSADLDKTVRIQGGMSREAVKKVIDAHLDEITSCYETALIANPSLMGKVVFEWKILLSGQVGEVRIQSSTVNSTDIHACIKSAIKSWKFPQPKGAEVIVSYPFIFDIVGY